MADSWWSAPRTWRDVLRCVVGLHKCASAYGGIQRCTCGAFGPWPWFHLSRSEKREKWRTRPARQDIDSLQIGGFEFPVRLDPTMPKGTFRLEATRDD